MARYDRIATLPVPAAAEAFGGWLALRDLEGRERDAELGRRLRLHFLVLRPLLRIGRHGTRLPEDSLAGQASRTREELGVLPVRDPQRAALSELLDAMQTTDAEALAAAALRMAERSLEWGHRSAAEAYALCAQQLAKREELAARELEALGALARIALAGGSADEAESLARRAAALALQLGDREGWARATVALAAAAGIRGGAPAALNVVTDVQSKSQDWRAADVGVIGALAACAHLLDAGDAESALDRAWQALRTAPRSAQRLALLETIAAALTRLGLFDEADHCSALIEARAAAVPDRLLVRARRARLRAEAGDGEGYRKRAAALTERPAALPAAARLELARGAFLVGDTSDSRRHATAAAQLARVHLQPALARDAAELLASLDRTAGRIVAVQRTERPPSAAARRIASEVTRLGESLAPSVL